LSRSKPADKQRSKYKRCIRFLVTNARQYKRNYKYSRVVGGIATIQY